MQFRILSRKNYIVRVEMFGRIFHLNYFEIQKTVSGSKTQKTKKNDVLEITLDQWNERVRPWSAKEICLFAFVPRAMLLLLDSLLYKSRQMFASRQYQFLYFFKMNNLKNCLSIYRKKRCGISDFYKNFEFLYLSNLNDYRAIFRYNQRWP